MTINSDKPHLWKADIAKSVDFYNRWFMQFAPSTYRKTRVNTTKQVETALELTSNLRNIKPETLRDNPTVLPILRMSTAPPIARDRLIGLAQIPPNLVRSMELENRIPPQMDEEECKNNLETIGNIIKQLADKDIFPWLETGKDPSNEDIYRAATIVADRLCGAVADPIVRNEQEKRQLASIKKWLEERKYDFIESHQGLTHMDLKPGTFSFRFNVPVKQAGRKEKVNIPIDIIVMPHDVKAKRFPLLIEAKSAGDFTNTNKRRKEEATKIYQLRATYGKQIKFILFLCGYFDSGYLGYEAAEGIDWVWEHRIDDLVKFDL